MELTKKSDRLGKEPIVPLLFKLSVPSIIAMAIQALYNVVDSIYIGRLSTEALSALSLCFPIQMIIIGIAVGTGVGASSLISRLLGKGNKSRASNAAEHVIIITVLYGITVGLMGFFFSDRLLHMFTNDPQLIEMGAHIKAFDPQGIEEARENFDEYNKHITYCDNEYEVMKNSNALVLLTEWNQFRRLNLGKMKTLLKDPIFFDLRNVYEQEEAQSAELDYIGVGVPTAPLGEFQKEEIKQAAEEAASSTESNLT